ncbi:MAG: hypothetical protein QW175_00325 [Candidatus Bathyarchaeia archaeon]
MIGVIIATALRRIRAAEANEINLLGFFMLLLPSPLFLSKIVIVLFSHLKVLELSSILFSFMEKENVMCDPSKNGFK